MTVIPFPFSTLRSKIQNGIISGGAAQHSQGRAMSLSRRFPYLCAPQSNQRESGRVHLRHADSVLIFLSLVPERKRNRPATIKRRGNNV